MQIYIKSNGVQSGPFTESKVAAMVADGKLSVNALAWHEHADGWTAIKDCDFIPLPKVATAAPAQSPQQIVVHVGAPASQQVTTELTSKKLKGRIIVAWGLIIIGIIALPLGIIPLLIGIPLLIWTRVSIWWNHK